MKIVADEHIAYVHEYFDAYGEVVLKPGRDMTATDVKDADILLVRSITHVDQALLSHSKVKFVGSITAGADHLDTRWLEEAGIPYARAVGFNAPPVADYVVSVIAALQRKQIIAFTGMKAAVIGVGNVGQLVADQLHLLGMQVVLCDPIREAQEENFQSTPLEKITDADIILLHVPLTRHGEHPTYHMINQAFLEKQKPRSVLLNASRGAVVDSNALLSHGKHMVWCLDVWEHEPKIDKSILEQALIATPHIAGYSVQSKIRGIDMIYREACQKKIISAQPESPKTMPSQELSFSGTQHHWQDIVLGVFNPIIMTAMMRSKLLPEKEVGHLFDEMRNQFTYRHEFSYTKLIGVDAPQSDKAMLAKLGLEICNYQ